jgi:uroporphyrinogen decarboxylase
MGNDFFLEAGTRLVAAGVAGIIVSDDYGFKTGPFFSPKMFKEYVLPFLTELVQTFAGLGVPVLLHSDGNINSLLDEIVATGISGLHPVEREAGMDLADLKKRYGKEICLFGNVSSTTTLSRGTEQDVEREVKECLEIAAPGGGYVLGSDHSLHEGIPVSNILKMIETAKRHGKYPGSKETHLEGTHSIV